MHTIKFHPLILTALLLTPFLASAESDHCKAKNIELWTKASYATDGSNLIIQGKRVRLIGLHSPQRERKQKFNSPGEPLAKESKMFFNKLLANNDLEVGVEYDETKVDRLGRQLVHLFLKDGSSIQKRILESGYAINRPANNNNKYAKCYFEAEQRARADKVNLWGFLEKYPDFHFPLAISSELNSQDKGFRIIQGKVVKVTKNANHYIINMDTTGIRIPKKHWDKFNYKEIQKLLGLTIEVRGMAYLFRGVMFMMVEEPNSIDRFNPIAKPL